MKTSTVRLLKMSITQFKNVKQGIVVFPNQQCATEKAKLEHVDLTGVYGQNGSGKTALIESLEIMKHCISGEKINTRLLHLFEEERPTTFEYEFLVKQKEESYVVSYGYEVKKESGEIRIQHEQFCYRSFNGTKFEEAVSIEEWGEVEEIEYLIAKKLANRNETSFIFSKELQTYIMEAKQDSFAYTLVQRLSNFVKMNLCIITVEQLGRINLYDYMLLKYRLENPYSLQSGELRLHLFEPSTIPKVYFETVEMIVTQINRVVEAIIPGLSIGLKQLGTELTKENEEAVRVQLLANRYEKEFPLKYESEGIRRIISIMSMIVAVYNEESVCLAIDELDAGIFEYLLGELMEVLQMGTKGQLIFTSHNLRALEKLPKKHLIFSTTNESNRYINLGEMEKKSNLRDVYLRTILLGGESEEVYDKTDKYEIEYALRKAGDGIYGS